MYRRILLVYKNYKEKTSLGNIKLLFWISLAWRVGEQDKKLTLSTNYTKTVIVLWDRRTNMGNRGVGSSTTRFVCFFRDNYITWPGIQNCFYRVLRISTYASLQIGITPAWN
jgi:hypothetical protein